MPNYLSRFRGVPGVGRWLDSWLARSVADDEGVFVLAYILGGAALPYARALLRRINKLVLIRSRYQENVPRALRARFGGALTALLFGKAVSELGRGPFWSPGFAPPCPHLVLVETLASRRAASLKVTGLSDKELGLSDYREVPISHDEAYTSLDVMKTATDWLKEAP